MAYIGNKRVMSVLRTIITSETTIEAQLAAEEAKGHADRAEAAAEEAKAVVGSEKAEPVAVDMSQFESEGKIVETYADGTTKTTTMEFDEDGNPIKITDGDGNETVLTW